MSFAEADQQTHAEALAELAELLKHPDDLNTKLGLLRRQLARDKASLDARLAADTQSQSDDVHEALEQLQATQTGVDQLRSQLEGIDQLCTHSKSLIDQYPRVQRISNTHRNFAQADDFYRDLLSFRTRALRVLAQLRAADAGFDDMQFNLLRIHYELRQLEQFRAKAHDCAKKPDTTADARMTLNALFKDLNALSNGFDNLVWRVARSAFDIARRRHGQLLVQLAKIVDTEETRDADIKARRRASGRDRDSQTSTVDRLEGRSPAAGVQQLRPRRVVGVVVRDINDDDADDPDNQTRGYKERLLDVFRSVVTRRTQELFAETERMEHDSGEPGTGLSQMTDMVVEELGMVFQAVAPCFPPQWKMRDFFLREYHLAVHRYIGELAANRDVLDGAMLLSLLRWSREYHSAMRRTLGVPDSLLEPRILDGREDQLVGEYLGLVRDKLTQWLTNLMNEETSNFRDRTKDVDREGERYYLGIAVQMFSIVDQQIDAAAKSNRGRVLVDVVAECVKIFAECHKRWKIALSSELRQHRDHPDETPGGLVDYVIALANDQLRAVEFADAIVTRVAPALGRSFQERFRAELQAASDGFMDVAYEALAVLCKLVFYDVEVAFQELFTPRWYEDDSVPLILDTMRDYGNDFAHLHPFLATRLMNDMLDRFAAEYLQAVGNRDAKFRRRVAGSGLAGRGAGGVESAAQGIAANISAAEGYFSDNTVHGHLELRAVRAKLEPLAALRSLVDGAANLLMMDFMDARDKFPDMPIKFVETVLAKRDDMDRSAVKRVVESINDHLASNPALPSATAAERVAAGAGGGGAGGGGGGAADLMAGADEAATTAAGIRASAGPRQTSIFAQLKGFS